MERDWYESDFGMADELTLEPVELDEFPELVADAEADYHAQAEDARFADLIERGIVP